MPYYYGDDDSAALLDNDYESNEDGWLDASYEDRHLNAVDSDFDYDSDYEQDYDETELAQFDADDELNAADEMAHMNYPINDIAVNYSGPTFYEYED
jgi:hypothetical protein